MFAAALQMPSFLAGGYFFRIFIDIRHKRENHCLEDEKHTCIVWVRCFFRSSHNSILLLQTSAAADTTNELKNLSEVGEGWRQLSNELCDVNDYDMTVAFYSKFPSWGSWVARGFLAVGTGRHSCACRSSSKFKKNSSHFKSSCSASYANFHYISLPLMLFIQKFALFLSLHYTLLHEATPLYHFVWRWLRISWCGLPERAAKASNVSVTISVNRPFLFWAKRGSGDKLLYFLDNFLYLFVENVFSTLEGWCHPSKTLSVVLRIVRDE